MADYQPKTFTTGGKFTAGDATQISQQLNEEEEINVAQQATLNSLARTTISALKAATTSTTTAVNVLGYYAAGDGGGGVFRYDSSDTTSADNGGTILTSTGGLTGRWKRVYEGEVNARWFGVNPSQTDNTAALQKAVDWVCDIGGTLLIPAGGYDFAFSGATTITVDANSVLIRGEGKGTSLKVVGSHSRPSQVDYFFTFDSSSLGRGQGGGVKDINFNGNSKLKWCVYLGTWRDAEFSNISSFDLHGGILDAEATSATYLGEGIAVRHLDHSGITGTTVTQYGVRFRTTGSNSGWSDCSIRDCLFVLCWDTGVVLDGVNRFIVSGIQAANNGTSTDTIDGSSKSGCLHAVTITSTITKSFSTGWHVVDSVYLESQAGSETFANNNAVFIRQLAEPIVQIRWNRISNVMANGTSTGLLKLADDSGFGRLLYTTFTGNRETVSGSIIIGSAVQDTDLYLTPDDGRSWDTLISDSGTNTRVNGVAPIGVVLRTPPAVYDSFTAANSSAADSAKWTTSIGAGSGAAISVQGNALQLTTGATGGYSGADYVALSAALGSTLVDGEIEFCLISSSVTVESYLHVALRSANVIPNNGASAYVLLLAQNSGGSLHAEVVKRVSSSNTTLYTGPSVAQSSGQKTWFRFRVKGTSLKLWTWADGNVPATIPAWSGTDSGVTGGGYATFAYQGGSAAVSGIQKIDNAAVYAL